MKKKTYNRMVVVTLFVVLLLLGGFFYFFRRTDSPKTTSGLSIQELIPPQIEKTTDITRKSGVTPTTISTNIYTDPKGRFSFNYPDGFNINSMLDEQGGEIVTVQNSTNTEEGLQIRVQESDEDVLITPDRIRADIPDIAITEPQAVTLGGKGKGTMFSSDDPAFNGASREVWFSYKRDVYQVSASLAYDGLVRAILGTWRFK